MAYGYQYIPNASRDERSMGPSVVRVRGEGHVHPLDRAASAIAEAIAAVYRDIDELRSTVPELVSVRSDDGAAESEATA